jgi:hypothetical protein
LTYENLGADAAHSTKPTDFCAQGWLIVLEHA